MAIAATRLAAAFAVSALAFGLVGGAPAAFAQSGASDAATLKAKQKPGTSSESVAPAQETAEPPSGKAPDEASGKAPADELEKSGEASAAPDAAAGAAEDAAEAGTATPGTAQETGACEGSVEALDAALAESGGEALATFAGRYAQCPLAEVARHEAARRQKADAMASRIEARSAPYLAYACDALAASTEDPQRPENVPGVAFNDIDAPLAIEACRIAAEANPQTPRLTFELGYALDKAGQDREALEAYRKAADAGYPHAWTLIGTMYDFGEGVPQDDSEAVSWYTRAAEADDPLAQRYLGTKYRDGDGVEQSWDEAARWYARAAAQGEAFALNEIGWFYETGRVFQQDVGQAAQYYRLAAEKGNSTAQYNLGLAYLNGRGVAEDARTAAVWLRRSAEAGDTDAQFKLALLYREGRGVAIDPQESVYWFRKAAEASNLSAQNELGLAYERGEGVERDMGKAEAWYRKAAAAGQDSAQNNLGVLYRDGDGLPQDSKQAVAWLEKAAAQGNAVAHANLAFMYIEGTGGLERDQRRAARYLIDAYALGEPRAEQVLIDHRGRHQPPDFRRAVQERLKELGFYNGAIDAVLGRGTEAALRRYREQKG
ncbi:peptidoglycan-binding protein [Afifella sp. IM 167]|uniref:peptidoglycan-binding protein n=1 Tax=Afifella sp. IM 167 TaxID=2033586 RepID=UPI001CCB7C71|nr:peptidoglycan-binding protein [Afifella sp. IM 167]MBZ8133118.1 hypothetical protein [Afifella sp. IM 167]